MNSPMDLKLALTDVRRAYRLVYAYQRRIFDLVGAIAEPLESAGFELDRWEPSLFSLPSRAFYKADKWAWDFLPGYSFTVSWNRILPGDVRRASLAVISDTGFERKRAEPDPSDFTPAEKSQSELRISLWRSEVTPAWDKTGAILSGEDVPDGQDRDLDLAGVTCRFRRHRVDLTELIDEAAVDKRALGPVRQWISA